MSPYSTKAFSTIMNEATIIVLLKEPDHEGYSAGSSSSTLWTKPLLGQRRGLRDGGYAAKGVE